MTARRALAAIAVLAALFYLTAPAVHDRFLHVVAKPVPALALAAIVRSARRDGYSAAIASGLVLSAIGDALLEMDHFVAGLATFLCAHVAYTAAFVRDERQLRLGRAVPFAVWLLAAFFWVRPGLGDMTVPVVVYMAAIGTMMWRAAARWREHPGAAAALVGAILFGLSDTLIAIDRFRAPLPGVASLAIILLYWAGQTGIAASAWSRAASYPSRDG